MANLSDASGTMSFSHPTASPALLEKFIEFGHKNFEYGSLEGYELDDIDQHAAWSKSFDFMTVGRWAFTSTMERYFENFGDASFVKELNGLIINITEYTDYEPGCDIFEEGSFKVKAVYNTVTNELTTELYDFTSSDLPKNAESLIQNGLCDDAWDTFTDYGIQNLWNIIEHANKTKSNLPKYIMSDSFGQLIENIHQVTPAMLETVIKDEQIDEEVTDSDEIDIIKDFFEGNELFEHALLKQYKK